MNKKARKTFAWTVKALAIPTFVFLFVLSNTWGNEAFKITTLSLWWLIAIVAWNGLIVGGFNEA